jgi:hypothetical protein
MAVLRTDLKKLAWAGCIICLYGCGGGGTIRPTPSEDSASGSEGPAGDQAAAAVSPEEDKDIYAWFDTLGFPDVTKCFYAEVATGHWFRQGNDPPENTYIRAFLAKDEGPSFTVFTLGINTQSFTKTGAGTPEHERVGYRLLNLESEMVSLLEKLRKPKDDEEFLHRPWDRIDEDTKLLILARACAGQRLENLAHDLLEFARNPVARRGGEPATKSFRQRLSDKIAHLLLWRAVKQFGDPAVTRKELLVEFEAIQQHYPEGEAPKDQEDNRFGWGVGKHASMTRQYVALLKQMIEEDGSRPVMPLKPENEMTTKERVAELIFQLRDQNGSQWSQPGHCDIFNDPRGEQSPAHQLVKVGFDAVPQLIEALDDKRFTRSVGYHRDFYFSHHVLRVGDCAMAILGQIAGRSFWSGTYTNAAMAKDGQVAETRSKVRAWWEEFEKKGEKQSLIEGVQAGDDSSDSQADRLVAKYPDSALSAIRQGLKASKKDWLAQRLVKSACQLKGEDVLPFLLEELSNPLPSVRVAAARGLLDRGRDEAVKAMIEEWHKAKSNEVPEDLINFLLWCGKVETVNVLAKDLSKRPVDVTLHVIEAIHSCGWDWKDYEMKLPDAARQAIDAILVAELDDSRERTGMAGTWDDKSFSNPRLCDMTGHVLAKRLNEPTLFDLSGSLKTRDRQRIELKNLWLKKQGKPTLPIPEGKKIKRFPNKEVQPLLQRFETAKSEEDRQAAARPILQLGLPALPAVLRESRVVPSDHLASVALKALAAQMACIVDEVQFSKESVAPTDDFRARVKRLQGQPLTPDKVVDLLLTVTKALPPGVTGIRLSIDREGDDTGFTLAVTLTKKKAQQEGTQKGWSFFEMITVAGENTWSTSGGCSWEHGMTEDNWRSFGKQLQKTFALPPEQSIAIGVGIVQEE